MRIFALFCMLISLCCLHVASLILRKPWKQRIVKMWS